LTYPRISHKTKLKFLHPKFPLKCTRSFCFVSRYTQYNCSAKSNQLVLKAVKVYYENNLTDLGKVIPLCYLITSNPVHISTTHDQHTFVYHHFPTTFFNRFIRPSSGTGYKHINENYASCVFHIDIVTSSSIMLMKFFKLHLYDSLDFSDKLYGIFYVLTIPLLGIIFNLFYQVHCERKVSSITYSSIYVLVSCPV